MDIANNSLDWDTEDVVALRNFLGTRAGQRFIPKLLESVPALLAGGPTNEILIRAGELRGWQGASTTILSLAYPPPEPQKERASAYASLDDEDAWRDQESTGEVTHINPDTTP